MLKRVHIVQLLVHLNEKIFFYPKLKKFYSAALKSKTPAIIDVGSNKGQSIDFFKKINTDAMIFGFEPNRNLYELLLKKYQSDASITLINKGISNIEGKLIFHENIMNETSTFETLNLNSEYLKKKAKILGVTTENIITESYEVEVTTLRHFLQEHKDFFFDVLKIDVEGHELQSLKGLFVDNEKIAVPIKFIQIESHHDDMYINNNQQQEIEELLRLNNFLPVIKIKHGFGDFYEIVYENKKL